MINAFIKKKSNIQSNLRLQEGKQRTKITSYSKVSERKAVKGVSVGLQLVTRRRIITRHFVSQSQQ